MGCCSSLPREVYYQPEGLEVSGLKVTCIVGIILHFSINIMYPCKSEN